MTKYNVFRDFPGDLGVKILPSNTGGASVILFGPLRSPPASQPKNQNIKQNIAFAVHLKHNIVNQLYSNKKSFKHQNVFNKF